MRVSWGKLGVAGAVGAVQVAAALNDQKHPERDKVLKKWENLAGLAGVGLGFLGMVFDIWPDISETVAISSIPRAEVVAYNWFKQGEAGYVPIGRTTSVPLSLPMPQSSPVPRARSYYPEAPKVIAW